MVLTAAGFEHPLRRYQAAALDAFEAARAAGQTRVSLVLPPGGGKTVVGLEAARRIGRRTLVLAPSVAVQGQWIREWSRFRPAEPASSDRLLTAPVSVLTYQSLAVVDAGDDAQQRRAALRAGDTDGLLDVLHPRGRELIDRAAALAVSDGPWTLVLDECHHLLALWGGLLRAVADRLGPDTAVLGLTATPPAELTGWQRSLQQDLFAGCAYNVPTPALVREGDLAPYLELLYLTSPTIDEQAWLDEEVTRFADLTLELADATADGVSLLGWLDRRVSDRRELAAGATLPWHDFAAAEPDLAGAAVRFAAAGMIPLPAGAAIAERERRSPDARDWSTVLADYSAGHLAKSKDPEAHRLQEQIRAVLPGLGVQLTVAGPRATTSPVDRMVSLSSTKHAATSDILGNEWDVRGGALRALVLTDFENEPAQLPASLRDVRREGDRGGITGGSAQAALATLARAQIAGVAGGLRPVLVTGRTLAASAEVAADLISRASEAGLDIHSEPLPGHEGSLVQLVGAGFGPAAWTPLATAHLAAGDTHCLIGTRGLLGEGWDCPAVNVVVDLTSAATATSVAQSRGRSLRLDPADPQKVATNWTVAVVADGHPRGDADWQRAVRKHEDLLALAPDGEIETAIGHCAGESQAGGAAGNAAKAGAAPDDAERLRLTAVSLARAADPLSARAAWRIGEPYAVGEVAGLRVRLTKDLGVPSALVPRRLDFGAATKVDGHRRSGRFLGGRPAVAGGALVAAEAVGIEIGAGPGLTAGVVGAEAVIAAGLLALRVGQHSRALTSPSGGDDGQGRPTVLGDLAAAVADGLHGAGLTTRGADAVSVWASDEGWLRVSLAADDASAQVFRSALDEVLAPLAEPRHIVGRPVVVTPTTSGGRRRLALRSFLGLSVDAAVVWHAVPSAVRNKAALTAYVAAWSQRVCGGRAAQQLSTADPDGRAVLDLMGGLDPFGAITQMRTTWS